MKTLILIWSVFLALVAATIGWAQPIPPGLGGTGCPSPVLVGNLALYATAGASCQVSDADDANDCSSGDGSTTTTCCYDGSTWSTAHCGGGGGGGDITGPVTTVDKAVPIWSGTGGNTLRNSECVTTDIDGDALPDQMDCPEGFTSSDQLCTNNTDCNYFRVYKNDGGGTPTCATMGAAGTFTAYGDNSGEIRWCDGTTETSSPVPPEYFEWGNTCATNTDCNYFRIPKNSLSTGTPDCGDEGLANTLTLLPQASDDTVDLCDGTTVTDYDVLHSKPYHTRIWAPTGYYHNGAKITSGTELVDGQCTCWLLDGPSGSGLAEAETMVYELTTISTDDKIEVGLYSSETLADGTFDGFFQYFECTLDLNPGGGAGQYHCDNEKAAAASAIVPADYWLCIAYDNGANDTEEAALEGATNGNILAKVLTGYGCSGGELPDTITNPETTATWTDTDIPFVIFYDED